MTSRKKKTENRKKRKLKELERIELQTNYRMSETKGGTRQGATPGTRSSYIDDHNEAV